jgi:alkaline phosphatase
MKLSAAALSLGLLAAVAGPAEAQDATRYGTGNVIFFHPDGTGLNHWNAGRMYWEGPDGTLNWDTLDELAVYRGHLLNQLASTSNGGATAHAFGYKVLDTSFGKDGTRTIDARSGFAGSIMREAAAAGMPTGLVNDGDMAEPGTAVFVSEVDSRYRPNEIVRQMLDGRPGAEGEAGPVVILAGGEAWFLPSDAPRCTGEPSLDCFVHSDPVSGEGPARTDGRNLLRDFSRAGYTVIRTRTEFDALWAEIQADATFAPRVLGLFARDDIFNDQTEEELIEAGLVDDVMVGSKQGRLVLWGGLGDTQSHNPPTVAEMSAMALELLDRHAAAAGQHWFLVVEGESNDNLSNNANAIGMLNALKRADDAVGLFQRYIEATPQTLLVMAADSDGGAPQVFGPPPVDSAGNVTVSTGNPSRVARLTDVGFPLDGVEGRGTAPFMSAPSAFGDPQPFAIGWPGTEDVAGAVVARAHGLNAELLRTHFRIRFDNIDLYRLMYATLFGRMLPDAYGEEAPDRAGR